MEAKIEKGTILSPEEELTIRGHEFHYTKRVDEEELPAVYRVSKQRRTKTVTWEEGYRINNTVGGYPHFHFYANPAFAKNFLTAASKYRREGL